MIGRSAPIGLSLILLVGSLASGNVLTVERGSNLQAVIDHAADGDTLLLGAKTFEAEPSEFVEPLCGNCGETQTEVNATYGFIIKGKKLILTGTDRAQTRLVTKAGYGLYLEDADGTEIRNLTITGGIRTDDGNATDAAIVVRRSRVTIEEIDVLDNNDRSSDTSVIVGIGGIFGREGAEIIIRDCKIINCSWDGIALYRGATAYVSDCLIQDGRGAGIGVTWDSYCVAFRNDVSGFWKGIGSFGTSTLIAANNLVHDNLGWGVIATGQSTLEATNNVIHHNGNCGFAPWSIDCHGRFVNNIVTANGWRDQWVCPCVGVWNNGDWAKWDFRNNIVWGNEAGEYEAIWNQTDMNGNLSVDPQFVGEDDFRLAPESPATNAGDPSTFNLDGTRSHIGLFGGPRSKR